MRGHGPSHRAKLTRWALAVILLGFAGACAEWLLRRTVGVFLRERGKQ